jgi:hypothetical protein
VVLGQFERNIFGQQRQTACFGRGRLKELASDGPGQLGNGTPVPAKTVEWLSCDSELHRIVMSGRSTVLDYGSSVRTISPALWAALVVRDQHLPPPRV